MDDDQYGGRPGVFAQRLDTAFRTILDPSGRPYGARAVAAAITRAGCLMSHTYLSRLRRGKGDPRRSEILAIAAFFQMPVTYFLGGAAVTADPVVALWPESTST